MNTHIPVIDDIGWTLVQLVMLVQAKSLELLSRYYQPDSFSKQIELMGAIYGAYYIASTPKDEVPNIVRDKLTNIGRFLIALVLFLFIFKVVSSL